MDATPTTSPLPKYYRLAARLRRQILSGELEPGAQLATEEQLCRDYAMSRGTVRQAIRLLTDEGLLRREQGRGTFVIGPSGDVPLFNLISFDEEMRRQHRQPATRILEAVVAPASPDVAERLEIAEGAPVIRIERLRLADSQPIVHEVRELAQDLCPDLLEEDLTHHSIHSLLINKYRIPMVRMVHVVEAHRLTRDQARLLEAPPGAPAFYVDRLTFTAQEGRVRPAVWRRAIYRGDAYHMNAQFRPVLLGEG
jgi:GntR family transcriptional regulator